MRVISGRVGRCYAASASDAGRGGAVPAAAADATLQLAAASGEEARNCEPSRTAWPWPRELPRLVEAWRGRRLCRASRRLRSHRNRRNGSGRRRRGNPLMSSGGHLGARRGPPPP